MKIFGGLFVLFLLLSTNLLLINSCNPFHGGGGDYCDHVYRLCLDGCSKSFPRGLLNKKYYVCQAVCYTACVACKVIN